MPENVNPLVGATAPNAEAHNAEIAAKLAAQDAAGHSTAGKPGEFEEAASALDKMQQAAEEAAKKKAAEENKPVIEPANKPAEDEAAKKAAEEAAAAAAKKAEEEKAAADAAAAAQPDPLKEIQEPENASQKARDNWKALREKAAAEIAARDQRLAEAQKKIAEFEERAKNPTTEQLQKEKELEELRLFRAKLDVQFDPQFKQFDTKLSQNEEFIYAQLRKSPAVGDDTIEQIKKFGGPDKCNLTELFNAMKDPTLTAIVQAKIAENAQLRYQKDQAITSTKANIETYLRDKEKSYADAVVAHTTATQSELNRMLGALEWAKPRAVEGDEVAKAAATSYNAELDTIKSQVADALRDDSPQMRAILLTSYANMCHLQNANKEMKAQLDTANKALADITDKFNKVKKASTSRLRESGASNTGATPQAKPANQFTQTAADSLDNLARTVMAERAAKGQ